MVFGPSMPDKVGRYEIVLQIARGGMATVYLARAEGLGGFDRYVALKLTAENLRDDPEFAHHLIEEAKLVAHLRHTNVVPVLDVGADDLGAVFLVMEYVPGDSLAGLTRSAKAANAPMPPAIGMRILVDALAGLHAAHEHTDEDSKSHHIVHRDFSPHNILVGTDGIARLTDFGIAKATSRASMTLAGTVKGKVSYASPEQARGYDLDRRCDVWAAGVVAWEIFAKRKLYPSNERTLFDIVEQAPPRLREVVPDVPADIDQVIAGALTMELADRTATAQMFGRAIAAAARNAGMLAEVEEVAEYVQSAVAEVLNERRDKIAQTRRLRELAAASEMESDPTTATYAMKTMPLPSLPDIPMLPEGAPTVTDDQFMSGATVPMPKAMLVKAPEAMLSPGRAATKMSPVHPLHAVVEPLAPNAVVENPSTTPSGVSAPAFPPPVLPPPPLPPGSGIEPSPSSVILNRATTVIQLMVDRGARLVAERPVVVLAAAGTLAVLLLVTSIVVVVAGHSGRVDEKTSERNPKTASSASAPIATASAVTAPPRTKILPPAPATPGDDIEPPPIQLEVAANAPIARLRVGGRMVDVEVPAPKVTVELLPEESTTKLTFSATSTDGRFANGTWAPGDPEVSLTFGERKAIPRPPPKTRPTLPRR